MAGLHQGPRDKTWIEALKNFGRWYVSILEQLLSDLIVIFSLINLVEWWHEEREEAHPLLVPDFDLYDIQELLDFQIGVGWHIFLVLGVALKPLQRILVLSPDFGQMMLFDFRNRLGHHNLLWDVNFVIFSEHWVAQKIEGLHSVLWVKHQTLSHKI